MNNGDNKKMKFCNKTYDKLIKQSERYSLGSVSIEEDNEKDMVNYLLLTFLKDMIILTH
ncbi:MAG: hypothetical protein IKF79_02545 [Methanosphaera sp.]|nr:hypothetical protein [Methanosphaera sp.]